MSDELGPVLRKAAELFNDKLYFECHDVLEDAWSGARGEEREFLHGLLEAAVGMVHVANANHQGAVNLLSRSIASLRPFAPVREGLDVASLLEKVSVCLEKSRRGLEGKDPGFEPGDLPRIGSVAVE